MPELVASGSKSPKGIHSLRLSLTNTFTRKTAQQIQKELGDARTQSAAILPKSKPPVAPSSSRPSIPDFDNSRINLDKMKGMTIKLKNKMMRPLSSMIQESDGHQFASAVKSTIGTLRRSAKLGSGSIMSKRTSTRPISESTSTRRQEIVLPNQLHL